MRDDAMSGNYLGTSFLEQCCPDRTSHDDGNVLYLSCPVGNHLHMWLLGTGNIASATEEWNFFNFDLN